MTLSPPRKRFAPVRFAFAQRWLAALGVDPSEVDRLARETAIPVGSIGPAREV